MYKNYIFDLYGTLVDIHTNEYSNVFWKKIASLFHCYGAAYAPTEIKNAYDEILPQTGTVSDCDYPEYDVVETFYRMLQKKKPDATVEEARSIAYAFRTISRHRLKLYKGVTDCLSDIKAHGKSVFLLSNAQESFTGPELSILGLTGYFDKIYLSSCYGVKKPDKRYYQTLITNEHLNPKECLMVGNDPSADVGGASSIGMDTLYFHSNLSEGLTPPDNATYSVLDGDFMNVYSIIKKCLD